jgi:hypothetical protein
MNKLFGIGLPRTGTTSLAKALRTLGYRGENYCMLSKRKEKDENKFFEVNNSFYSCYKYLFTENEGSKFILTIRDNTSWETSVDNFQKTQITLGRGEYKDYRNVLPNITEYTQNVMKFFNDYGAMNQLLVVDLFDKGCDCICKWKNLYEFLLPGSYAGLPPRLVNDYNELENFPHEVSYWEEG